MWDVLGCCTLSTMLSESKDGVNFAISNKDWTPLLLFKWILTAVPLLIFDISYYVKYQNVTYFPNTEILWKGTVSTEFWGMKFDNEPLLKINFSSLKWIPFSSNALAMLWKALLVEFFQVKVQVNSRQLIKRELHYEYYAGNLENSRLEGLPLPIVLIKVLLCRNLI